MSNANEGDKVAGALLFLVLFVSVFIGLGFVLGFGLRDKSQGLIGEPFVVPAGKKAIIEVRFIEDKN